MPFPAERVMLCYQYAGRGGNVSESKLVAIYQSQGMLGAQVVLSKLEAAGIPAILKYESAGQLFGLTVDGLGTVEVQVPEDWAEEALALVEEEPGDSVEPGWQDTDGDEAPA
jgi:hypothetical protein